MKVYYELTDGTKIRNKPHVIDEFKKVGQILDIEFRDEYWLKRVLHRVKVLKIDSGRTDALVKYLNSGEESWVSTWRGEWTVGTIVEVGEGSGFTLVELLVVIAIMGVIAAVVVPTLLGFNK